MIASVIAPIVVAISTLDASRRLGGSYMATMSPRRPPVFNLPNQLTAARAGLAVVLFAFIAEGWWGWCLGGFALSAPTDYLAGYLSRLQGLTSTLRLNLDPLRD